MKEEILPNAVYTTDEAAQLLGLNIQTIQGYIRQGKIKASMIGEKWYRITGQAILDFLNGNVTPHYQYNPSRGGHAPSDLREIFYNYVDTGKVDLSFLFHAEEMPKNKVKWLLGKFWNCTDIMPGYTCETLDLTRGSTYAQGARKIAKDLDIEASFKK